MGNRLKQRLRCAHSSLLPPLASRLWALDAGELKKARKAKANGWVSRTDPPSLTFTHHAGQIHRNGPGSAALNAGDFAAADNRAPHPRRPPRARGNNRGAVTDVSGGTVAPSHQPATAHASPPTQDDP
jgi:hypothetical protein